MGREMADADTDNPIGWKQIRVDKEIRVAETTGRGSTGIKFTKDDRSKKANGIDTCSKGP